MSAPLPVGGTRPRAPGGISGAEHGPAPPRWQSPNGRSRASVKPALTFPALTSSRVNAPARSGQGPNARNSIVPTLVAPDPARHGGARSRRHGCQRARSAMRRGHTPGGAEPGPAERPPSRQSRSPIRPLGQRRSPQLRLAMDRDQRGGWRLLRQQGGGAGPHRRSPPHRPQQYRRGLHAGEPASPPRRLRRISARRSTRRAMSPMARRSWPRSGADAVLGPRDRALPQQRSCARPRLPRKGARELAANP